MRRLPTAAAITAVVALMIGVIGFAVNAMTGPVSAETSTTIINEGSPDGFVAVVKVSGLLDPLMVDFIRSSIDDANSEGALALVLQTDSNGVVVDDATFEALLNAMLASPVPIDVWVGPSGSHLTGLPAQLVGAADQVGMAPGSRLGDAGQPVVRRGAGIADFLCAGGNRPAASFGSLSGAESPDWIRQGHDDAAS